MYSKYTFVTFQNKKNPSTFFYTKLLIFFVFELYIHSATDTAFKAEIQLKTGNSVCVT